jgi:uncharacterized protein YjbJ (UPF0337 family)
VWRFFQRETDGWADRSGFPRVYEQLATCPPDGAVDVVMQRRQVMNWDRIEGNWKQVKGQVRQQWGKLTEDDLERMKGNRQELEGKLQERYGIAKDEANRQIDEWANRFKM